MDYKVVTRVNNLITALTDSKVRTLDDIKLRELKSLLKSSDELVSYAHDLLLDRLAANHSQVCTQRALGCSETSWLFFTMHNKSCQYVAVLRCLSYQSGRGTCAKLR